MTPLPARDPYNAAAEAPLSTDMLAIFSGLRSPSPFPISVEGFQKSLLVAPVKLSMGIPSMTIRGWLSPVRELFPLRTILEDPAGPLLPRITCRPAILPDIALAILFSR